jgi:hypothetical protein
MTIGNMRANGAHTLAVWCLGQIGRKAQHDRYPGL